MDETCDQFEAAWRMGPAPWIEDYLAGANGADLRCLRELLALERRVTQCGQWPAVEEYVARFPGHAGTGWPRPVVQ